MEQRSITFMWPRVFGLLDQVNTGDTDELVQGHREDQAIDRAAGNVLFMVQCLGELARETDRLDGVSEHVRGVMALPPIGEKEGVCLWARHHGNYAAFEEAVKIIKQLAEGVTTAESILDRLAVFNRECQEQTMTIFLKDQEKMKKEVKAK